MPNFISTYLIDTKEINLNGEDSDFAKSSSWEDTIIDEGGSFFKDHQYMSFNGSGFELSVQFDLLVSGRFSFDSGDYCTPPCSECEIEEVDINIIGVSIDGYEVELTTDIIDLFKGAIKKNL